jgi:hypothetical protein
MFIKKVRRVRTRKFKEKVWFRAQETLLVRNKSMNEVRIGMGRRSQREGKEK